MNCTKGWACAMSSFWKRISRLFNIYRVSQKNIQHFNCWKYGHKIQFLKIKIFKWNAERLKFFAVKSELPKKSRFLVQPFFILHHMFDVGPALTNCWLNTCCYVSHNFRKCFLRNVSNFSTDVFFQLVKGTRPRISVDSVLEIPPKKKSGEVRSGE